MNYLSLFYQNVNIKMATILSIYHVPDTSPSLSWYYFNPFYNKKAEVLVGLCGGVEVKYLFYIARLKSRGGVWTAVCIPESWPGAGPHRLWGGTMDCTSQCCHWQLLVVVDIGRGGIFTSWKLANTESRGLPPESVDHAVHHCTYYFSLWQTVSNILTILKFYFL